jgi:sec-independent protein translocase protein TatA
MGGSEILLILLAVLVLFGADKLPEFAKGLGKGLREVKKATDEIKNELTKESSEVINELQKIKDEGLKETNELKNSVNQTIDSVKNDTYVNPYKGLDTYQENEQKDKDLAG